MTQVKDYRDRRDWENGQRRRCRTAENRLSRPQRGYSIWRCLPPKRRVKNLLCKITDVIFGEDYAN